MDTRGKGAVESMRHVRMLGLCLVAVFAFGAIAAASASAKQMPEWGECEKVEEGVEGKYTDSNCTVRAPRRHGIYTGEYEWSEKNGRFHGSILAPETTSVTVETAAGHKIECTHVQAETSMTLFGPYGAITPLWLLEGCESEGQPCTTISIGSDPGNISNALYWLEEEGLRWTGQLGIIEGKGTPNPVVGLSYTSDNTNTGEREPFFTPISCEGSLGTVLLGGDKEKPHGLGNNSFIGVVTPVNQMTEELTLTYSEGAQGIQTPQQFGHGKRKYLQAFVHNEWEPVAITATMKFAISEREIKATK
jgi:hypothetical protein